MARWVLAVSLVVFASAAPSATACECDEEARVATPAPRDPAWDLLIRPTITTPTQRACSADVPVARPGEIASQRL